MINKKNIPELRQTPTITNDIETGLSRFTGIPDDKKCNIATHNGSLFIYGENFDYTKIRLPIEIIDLFNNLLTKSDDIIDISKFENEIKKMINNYINSDVIINIELQIEELLQNNIHDYLKNEIDISKEILNCLGDFLRNNIDIEELINNHLDDNKSYDSEQTSYNIDKNQIENIVIDYLKSSNLSELETQQSGLSKKEEQSLVDKITAKIKKELQMDPGFGITKPDIEKVLLLKDRGLPIEDIVMLHKNGLI